MKLGISILQPGDTLEEAREVAALADSLGFDVVGVPDTHSISREAYVAAAVIAMATTRARVGPMVTNPVTRHPTVIASAAMTLDELSGGRAVLGLGAGESAVANAGLAPATSSELEDATRTIRATMGALSDRDRRAGTAPPLFVAARGPRTIAAAARCADVVVLDLGVDPELVAKGVALAHSERAASPLADEPLEIWLLGKGYVSDDPAVAHAAVGAIMAASAAGLRSALDWKAVPERHRAALRAFQAQYQYARHAVARDGAGGNAGLLAESGLEPFVYERFALTGTAVQVAEQLRTLATVGVAGVAFTGAVGDKRELIARLGGDVRSALDGSVGSASAAGSPSHRSQAAS